MLDDVECWWKSVSSSKPEFEENRAEQKKKKIKIKLQVSEKNFKTNTSENSLLEDSIKFILV